MIMLSRAVIWKHALIANTCNSQCLDNVELCKFKLGQNSFKIHVRVMGQIGQWPPIL
jgi:hypothetical protein